MSKRRLVTMAAATTVAVGMVGVTATSAVAAGRDGVLNVGEMAFYYNSGCNNSLSDFAAKKANLAGYKYLSAGAGKGTFVKNNAACAANARASQNMRVYFNSNYMGVNDLIPAAQYGNLTNTYNENASFKWLG